jgi:ankyrin repeat protein
MDIYISNIRYNWESLAKLPTLTQEDIAKVNEPERMYLYVYYGYLNELRNYSPTQIKTLIGTNNIFLLAAFRNNLNIMKYLYTKLNNKFIRYNNKDGMNAYFVASSYGHIKIIKYLDSKNYKIKRHNSFYNNSYLLAILSGNLKLIKYFENSDRIRNTIYKINKLGYNPYLQAIKTGNLKIIKYLENSGFSKKNSYSIAAQYGHIKVMKYLENKGITHLTDYIKLLLKLKSTKNHKHIIKVLKLRNYIYKVIYFGAIGGA